MPARRQPALIATSLLILLAACTPGASPGSSGQPSPTSGAGSSGGAAPSASPVAKAELILRVTTEGGFVGPAANLNAIPELSVYADGRILSPGAVDAIAPAPLLPVVAVRDVGPAGAAKIVAAIRTAGLDKPSTAGPGTPGDFGTTVFSVDVDGSVVTSRLVLGGGSPGRPGLESPNPATAAAADLLARLQDASETWGAAAAPASVLVPAGYRLFVAPGAPASDGTLSPQPAVAWPLATALDQFGSPANPDRGIAGLRQGAVFGADAATLGPLLAAANSQTAFMSGGMLYTFYVRPLLPDEVPTPA
ncbi:MAG TPA: hypothetical protein VGI98_03030 [Candidatus Limnocylindrales bacterium]|jgi:hypothetical protein